MRRRRNGPVQDGIVVVDGQSLDAQSVAARLSIGWLKHYGDELASIRSVTTGPASSISLSPFCLTAAAANIRVRGQAGSRDPESVEKEGAVSTRQDSP